MTGSEALLRRWLLAFRRSMTAQISAAIAVISLLLVASSSVLLERMVTQELREGNELILFANLAFLHDDLMNAGLDVMKRAPQVVDRMELQLGNLHVAVLDNDRHLITASDRFEIPIAALPARALSVDDLPPGITQREVRRLQKRLGPLTSIWTAPDGRSFRVLFVRVPPPSQFAAAYRGPILLALAIELTQARELVAREWKIFVGTLLVGTLLASVLGVWVARRILVAAHRLGAAASRISAQALQERLDLAEAPTELMVSGLAFNRMLDRLEGGFKRLSDFSSDLAHDLRTPIHNLLGEAQVALSRPRSAEDYRAVLESAVEDYERLSRLIENMLFLARADHAQTATRRQWMALGPKLERISDYFEPLADERGVGFQIELHATPMAPQRIWADETLLTRALGNLVSNALRYAPRGSNIILAASVHEHGGCRIEVSNDGPSIAAPHQARLFERFFRADDSREGSASGSGLGLAIVQSVMELHGGTASVSSAPGERTVFSLWFPAPPAGAAEA